MSEENVVDTPAVPPEVEQEARVLGWKPKEEFSGDPEQWRDADEFLRRGKEINGFLRKDLEKIQRELTRRDQELAEVRSTVDEFRKYHEQTEDRAYKRALKELQERKKDAIEAGDGEAVIAVEEEIDGLKEARRAKEATPSKPAADTSGENVKVFQEWVAENQWFADNVDLRATANGFSDIVRVENPNLVGRAFLDEVTKRIKKAFPDRFENPNKSQPSAVDGGGSPRPTGSKKPGYNDLPAEAKAACDKFVKAKLLTQEQYVADYFAS
jgi:hypothetical protein